MSQGVVDGLADRPRPKHPKQERSLHNGEGQADSSPDQDPDHPGGVRTRGRGEGGHGARGFPYTRPVSSDEVAPTSPERCPRCGWDPHAPGGYEDRWCLAFTDRTSRPPDSAVTIEFAHEAEQIDRSLRTLEQHLYKLMAAWHGELQGRNRYHSMAAWFHEKAEGAEEAARDVREAIERISERRGHSSS